MEVTTNPLNPALFDASVAASIDFADIAPHDMMTCEVTLPGTDFDKRIEKIILEKNGKFEDMINSTINKLILVPSTEPKVEVHLLNLDALCESEDCNSATNDNENDHPVDYEAVEKTLEVGAAVDTFSGIFETVLT